MLQDEIQFGYHRGIHGTNIKLSGDNYTTANRKEELLSDSGITYSALPLNGTSEFEIEVLRAEPGKGSMSLGVTRVEKGHKLKPELMELVRKIRGFVNSCIWNTGKVYNTLGVSDSGSISKNYGYVDISNLEKGSRVGLQLSLYEGSLSFFVDGRHQGFAAKGVYDDRFDVYAVVEHTGGCCGTRITRAGKCTHNGTVRLA